MKQPQVARWLSCARSPGFLRFLVWVVMPFLLQAPVRELCAAPANLPEISVEDVAVVEPSPTLGSALVQVSVILSAPSSASVQVNVSASNVTAIAGVDYYFSPSTAYFSPGTTNVKISFAVYGDLVTEAEETFSIQLTSPVNAALGKAAAVCRIADYGSVSRLSIASASFLEGSGPGSNQISIPVTLSPPGTATVTVAYTTRPGTAEEWSDYVPMDGTLVFPPGVTNGNIVLTIKADLEEEPNEAFSVALVDPSGAVIENQWATITLVDDDKAFLSVSNTTVTEAFGSYALFNVFLSTRSVTTATVNYFTRPGTAQAGFDFAAASGTLTFPPGVTSQVAQVLMLDDDLYEGNETFFLCLTNASHPLSSNSMATATILDDEFPVVVDSAQVAEGNAGTNKAMFQVRLLQPFAQEVTLNYYTENGTALNGSDFIEASGSILFPPGVTNRAVEVAVLGDLEGEADEDFFLYVLNPNNFKPLAPGVGTIIDDEPRLRAANASVAEPVSGTNLLRFAATLSKTSSVPVLAMYSTVSGTAKVTADYVHTAGTLVFAPGQTSQVITVAVLADGIREPVESFALTFTNVQNAFLETNAAPGYILDTSQPFLSSFQRLIEPLGPSSRATDLVISEIMYHPPNVFRGTSGADLDFIELHNAGPYPVDIGGYRITGDISLEFPFDTILQPGEYLLLVDKPTPFNNAYGISSPYNFGGSLSDGGGTIRLRNRAGAVLLEVDYDNEPPWPALADGRGHSLVLVRPSYGENDPRAWDVSEQAGGSPGRAEPQPVNSLHAVSINEILANSVLPDFDFIELYNHGAQDVDISGCTLSDSPDTNKFVFIGAVIPAGSYFALDDVSLGFKLKAEGDTVYFRAPDGEILDVIRYPALPNGVAIGRYPEGGTQLYPLFPPTPFARNDALLSGDVVINEIMYAPLSGEQDGEYIELHNRTTNAVNVGGWTFIEGVEFTFPPSTIIPPLGYLVIARNISQLRATYPHLTEANTLGNFSGALSDSGERIVLGRPAAVVQGGATNKVFITEDEVDFRAAAARSQWSRGGGSSLELKDSRSENRFAANWADSDESAKSVWTTVQASWNLANQISNAPALQLMLLGAGECLVDEVELSFAGQTNLVLNGSFEAGLGGWNAEGNHVRASLEMTGFDSGQRSLHLRSSGGGNPAANHVWSALPARLGPGLLTVRAKARWLRGNPNLVLRLANQSFEASAPLPAPRNAGTPALENSRSEPNAGPSISDVQFSPLLPAAEQPVVVTAELDDFDGIGQVMLRYRIDPATASIDVPMRDDGQGGDRLADDGIFSASMPGQPAGALVAFHIVCLDNATSPATSRFPAGAPGRECLVRFGEPLYSGVLGGLRVWMTASNLQWLEARSRFSDEPVDCTLVYGNERVLFNAGVHLGGAALDRAGITSAATGLCSLSFILPDNEPLLGYSQWNLQPMEPGIDPSLLRGRALRWMAEQMHLPTAFERFFRFSLNGLMESQRGAPLFVMRQEQDESFIKAWHSDDSDGELFRISPRAEVVGNSNSISSVTAASLWDSASTIFPRQKGAYRWGWQKIAPGLMDDDYLHLYGLADALNAPPSTYENLAETAIDVEQWISLLALRRGVGDRDSYGFGGSGETFVYKGAGRKWAMLPGAFRKTLGAPGGVSPTNEVFACSPLEMSRFVNYPAFGRRYLRALQTFAVVALDPDRLRQAVLEPCRQVLSAHGLESPLSADADLLNWMTERRTYLSGLITPGILDLVPPYHTTNSQGWVTVRGNASPDITTINFGWQDNVQLTWTSLTSWVAQVLVPPGVPFLGSACGWTMGGSVVCSTQELTVTSTVASPAARMLVVSEIHSAPQRPGGGFIELYNPADVAFDTRDLWLPDFAFVFPSSSFVPPKGFVLLVEDLGAFTQTFGNGIPVAGELGRLLNHNGETILMIPNSDGITNKVKFASSAPWPAVGAGRSLHLIDPAQDNARVSNWVEGGPSPGFGVFASRPSFPLLWLNEVQTQNPGIVQDNAGENEPWLELFNSSPSTIVLGGSFFLTDTYSNLAKWAFPIGTTIAPGAFLTIWADGQTNQANASNLHTSFRLGAASSSLALVQAIPGGPRIVDYLDFPGLPPGRSYGSFPNGQLFDRELLGTSTPGASNRPPPIYINEWMARNGGAVVDPEGDSDDWFELYNASSEPKNLRGYALGDSGTALSPYVIPYDIIIPPRGFLVVWADGEVYRNAPNRAELHAPWNLGGGGDALYLFAPDGSITDALSFDEQTNNVSQGRFPDGMNDIRYMFLPTPGTSNRLFNLRPPNLGSLSNQVLYVGQTMRFAVSATDVDTPLSFLSFRLGAGAPAGAALQSTNFTWTPSAAQVGTNLITIQVTDNGTPPLTSSQTFQAVVAPPPRVSWMQGVPAQNQLKVHVPAFPGQTYRLEYKDSLQDPIWKFVSSATANGTNITFSVMIGTNTQQFFRITIPE